MTDLGATGPVEEAGACAYNWVILLTALRSGQDVAPPGRAQRNLGPDLSVRTGGETLKLRSPDTRPPARGYSGYLVTRRLRPEVIPVIPPHPPQPGHGQAPSCPSSYSSSSPSTQHGHLYGEAFPTTVGAHRPPIRVEAQAFLGLRALWDWVSLPPGQLGPWVTVPMEVRPRHRASVVGIAVLFHLW